MTAERYVLVVSLTVSVAQVYDGVRTILAHDVKPASVCMEAGDVFAHRRVDPANEASLVLEQTPTTDDIAHKPLMTAMTDKWPENHRQWRTTQHYSTTPSK